MTHMNIVIFGQQNWDVTWTEKQQFATRLAARGHRVLFVDPDSGSTAHTLRCLAADALWVLTPQRAFATLWDGDRHRARVVAKTAQRLGFTDPVVLSFIPRSAPWIQHLHMAGLVYFAVDEWTGFFRDPAAARTVRAQEERLLREADVAVGISPRLVERFQEYNDNTSRMANGVDSDRFSPHRWEMHSPHVRLQNIPSPRIGLVGQIDSRVNVELLEALATAHPEWQIVLAGRLLASMPLNALLARHNVHHVGFVRHEELPLLLQGFDVCLIPYHLSPHTHSCNPAKAYEYLASGVPIVATPLEGLDELRSAILFAETPGTFTAAVEQALVEPFGARVGRLALAVQFGWEERTDRVEAFLSDAVARRTERKATLRARLGSAAHGCSGERRAPLLDPKDEGDQRAGAYFADARFSSRALTALRLVQRAGKAYWLARVAMRTVTRRRSRRIRRILVARRAYLGDLVVLLPMLAALRERYPGAEITLGVHRGFSSREVLADTGLVNEVLEIEYLDDAGWQRIFTAAALFARGFDLVVHGVNYFLQREAFFTGAPQHAGIDDGHPWQAALQVSVPLQPYRHEAENNLAITDALGQHSPPAQRVPLLPPPRSASTIDELLNRLGTPPNARMLAMHVGSKRPSRRWPHDRFARLATELLKENASRWIVLTGVRGEYDLVELVRQQVPAHLRERLVNAAGSCSLGEMRLLLSSVEALVCNDTGVMHLARAQGTPLLALLGPENDARWGPHEWGNAPATAVHHEVPCAPCARNDCEYLWCLRALNVPEAQNAYHDLLHSDCAHEPAADAADGPGHFSTVPAASPALVPLMLRKKRHTFAQLASAGFVLPTVTVVLVGDAGAGVPMTEALTQLATQDYPAVQLLTCDRSNRWRDLVAVTTGEFVSVVHERDVAAWPPEKLSADVAALVRMPHAGLMAPVLTRLHEQADTPDTNGRLPGRAVRHAAFAAAVAAIAETTSSMHTSEVA